MRQPRLQGAVPVAPGRFALEAATDVTPVDQNHDLDASLRVTTLNEALCRVAVQRSVDHRLRHVGSALRGTARGTELFSEALTTPRHTAESGGH
jgi:hypothetical protein